MTKPANTYWNHRVVRQYNDYGHPFLQITEVYYRNGKPTMFALNISMPFVPDDEHENDEERIANLRQTLESMRLALDKPILDERKDFTE